MNKQALVEALAERLHESKAKAAAAVDALFGSDGIIASELRRGGRVQISGFGNFELRSRAARRALHPRTGKAISVRASRVPAFRAGKSLRDSLNEKGRA